MGDLTLCGPAVTATVSRLLGFLITIQAAALQTYTTSPGNAGNDSAFDPKTFVDLPLLQPLDATDAAFLALPKIGSNGSAPGTISNETLQKFVADHFGTPGSELLSYDAPDFTSRPSGFLTNVHNPEVRRWAYDVHEIWLNLSRTVIPDVTTHPDQYTMLPLDNPFVIPGSRFREVYYWDSYWVIRGLVVSKMLVTARGMVENLLSMVTDYGFVPNGARKYYLNRSQPPLLSQMVKTVYDATGDISLIEKALPILIVEHNFWTSARHAVSIVDHTGKVHSLSRYHANWNTTRPESSTIDVDVASNVPENRRPQLYNDIASAAETGWDFSSRWMEDRFNLSTLRTSRIVPTDLNSLVFQMEKDIALFANVLGDVSTESSFAQKAEARREAIDAILWNEDMKQWNDYWLPDECPVTANGDQAIVKFELAYQNAIPYASNFIPLWCGVVSQDYAGRRRVDSLVKALKSSGLVQTSGIATSMKETGQQWDYPNGWAPLQHMIIEGLHFTHSKAAKSVAKEIAISWLRTNFASFETTGAMHEKYDVTLCGESGGGGEYISQTGFGWTNGVALALLDHYGWPEHRNISCQTTSHASAADSSDL